jgi:putative ABC transport system permease protein
LSLDDAEAVEDEIPQVAAISPEYYTYVQVTAGNQNWKTKVYGEALEFFSIREWPLTDGEVFTEADLRNASKVAILGQTTVGQLFGEEDPIGETVRIQNVPFTILGVLSSKGFSVRGHDQDEIIIVPHTTALKRLLGKNTPLYGINLQVTDASVLEEAEDQITGLLRQRHRIGSSKEDDLVRDDDFVVRGQQEIVQTATATTRTMTVLLGAIASVSLIVGGIGIMNIMLVSVTERTREIGIRLAVGARQSDILRQFLIEAFTLSSLGGIMGILLGIAASKVLAAATHWPTLIAPEAVAFAFLFSAGVGIFFGYYPARKASQLDPIDALRYE